MVLLCAMTMADCSELKESIADAQRLLQYASIKGIEVPPDLLAQIVGAQALSSTEPEDPATFKGQEEFWSALSKLSVLTKPAPTDGPRSGPGSHAAGCVCLSGRAHLSWRFEKRGFGRSLDCCWLRFSSRTTKLAKVLQRNTRKLQPLSPKNVCEERN